MQTAAADRTGKAATASTAAFRSPDPRTGRSFAIGTADAILGLVHAQAQARAQVALGQSSAHGEAEAQASSEGSASDEAHAWSSGSGEGSSGGAAAQPADNAAQAHPIGTAVQSQTIVTVSVEVQTYNVTANRPPKDVRDWWENVPDARRFLDAAYKRLGETADTPRSLDDWCIKVGFLTLSRGTLGAIADSSSGKFTQEEMRAAQAATSVWDHVWGTP
ncbi:MULTISPECIES: hypothetical protein [unclassified Methylobacterium]|uniref:hypothetical protein n=1 Tax=unclassified Methylobacterium TaxID=2615210 RepID=UPI0013531241|nr:hypothetical protein [Methylobacterium sp. 2A]MWV23793.1 hypothetical protein [Methylobacterium sp. 2A]